MSAILDPAAPGDDGLNAAAGMAKPAYAAAYIRTTRTAVQHRLSDPVLTEQQAWDVAAYMITKPRPPAPPGAEWGAAPTSVWPSWL